MLKHETPKYEIFSSKLDHKSNEHRNLGQYMRLLSKKSLIYWHFTVGITLVKVFRGLSQTDKSVLK